MRAPFSSFIIYTPTSISPPPLIHSHSLSFGHTSHPAPTTFKIMGAETKVFTLAEVSQHNNPKDCWLVIDGKVYDVTKFLEEHPGGDEVLLNATGKDATDDFDDVGHSNSAREMLVEFYVGDIDSPKYSKKTTSESPKQLHSNQGNSSEFIIKLLQILVPLAILGLAFGIRFYTKSTSA